MSVTAKRKFGQNFLVSTFHLSLLESKAINFLKEISPAKIMEIGPGEGALTQILLQQNLPVLALEIDPEAMDFLVQKFQDDNLELRQTDALECFSKLNQQRLSSKGIEDSLSQIIAAELDQMVLISNLPYNVASRILIELTLPPNRPLGFLVMLQKEVAEKILLKKNHMNVLGGILQLYWDLETVAIFPRSAFRPQPKIESALLHGLKKIAVEQEFQNVDLVLKVIKNLLKYPSKTLVNNLKNLDWSKVKILEFMSKNELPLSFRLTVSNFREVLKMVIITEVAVRD